MKSVRLSDLTPGAWAVIAALPDGIPSLTRIRELGLLPGTRLQFIRRAPLGDPVEISVRGALLSLRDTEAMHITVDPVPEPLPGL
jgi:ferrous iron transport protein A